MKNKHVVLGLAMALSAVASCPAVNAQLGGLPASGSDAMSSGSSGKMGQSDFEYSHKQAIQLSDPQIQNYISPETANPGINDHAANQEPYVRFMKNGDSHGLAPASTSLMAPNSLDMSPFPSGQFNYGFDNGKVKDYRGPYAGGQNAKFGGLLPNTSLGSVDFNTVDTTGIAPAGMRSPGRGMASPIGPAIPNPNTSLPSTLNWLNTFFGFPGF